MLFKYCGIIGLLLNIPIRICITVIHPSIHPSLPPSPPSLTSLPPPPIPCIKFIVLSSLNKALVFHSYGSTANSQLARPPLPSLSTHLNKSCRKTGRNRLAGSHLVTYQETNTPESAQTNWHLERRINMN